jgi:uncharacterized protein (DUF2252 family)
VQCCGDAHLSNFGVFAAPDRRMVFDLNDFDETLPAPFEWDVKRLAASFVVACRDNKLGKAVAKDVRNLRPHLPRVDGRVQSIEDAGIVVPVLVCRRADWRSSSEAPRAGPESDWKGAVEEPRRGALPQTR